MISIAVTAVVSPSRQLRAALGVFYVALCVVLVWLFLHQAMLATAVGVLCGVGAALSLRQHRQAWRIAISGQGQIRLTVYRRLPSVAQSASNVRSSVVMNAIVMHDHLVYLQPGCTVWPFLLLLCLETEYGQKIKLLIMRDSVEDAAFRALCVAIKAISNGKLK